MINCLLSVLQADELDYTFKRLVDGLAHTREAARPGFSLALGQVSGTPVQFNTSFTGRHVPVSLRLVRK